MIQSTYGERISILGIRLTPFDCARAEDTAQKWLGTRGYIPRLVTQPNFRAIFTRLRCS
jgi:hypothetical protein